MAVTYNKPAGLKYTDMCIYIDENTWRIVKNGENPEVEARIYEYLYHVLYALACKQTFFKNFEEYDSFALYGAGELYISLRNKFINQGKEVRGKLVQPVKSVLNFIKSVLFPLKVNFQRQNYAQVFNPEIDQDTQILQSDMRSAIKSDYLPEFENTLSDVFYDFKKKVYEKILLKTPYRNDKVFLKRLYISCVLTLLYQWTLPEKIAQKLNKKTTSDLNFSSKYIKNMAFQEEVIVWHLDEKYRDYVRFQVNKIKHLITDEIEDSRKYYELDDEVVDNILKTAYATYDDSEGE